jgi:hypothetical protein
MDDRQAMSTVPTRKPRPFIRRWLARSLLFCAAVILLLEEWLWKGTARFLKDLSRLPVFAAIGAWFRRRTPHQALALFVLPLLSLLPLKGVIVLAFMHGRIFLGFAVLVLEKLIFSAVFAALYQLTGPAVTQIGWVLRMQEAFLRVRRALHGWLARQAAFRQARAWLRRVRKSKWLRRRFGAAYRMQRRRARAARFCFGG